MARTSRVPLGVSARFSNQSGAFVDVIGHALATWECGGCPQTGGWRRRPVSEVSSEAQAHASQCTAVAR